MKRKIGILLCGHVREQLVPKYGEYGAFFRRLLGEGTFDYVDYFTVDGELPKAPESCDGYILSGSAHGAYDDLPFIAPLEEFIRQTYAANIPLVGICFGHQIMAQALGGRVEKFSGGWGLGIETYEMKLNGETRDISLFAVHQDQVVQLPPGSQAFASNDHCAYAALAYEKNAISFQPHPEFDAGFVGDLITLRRGQTFPEDVADKALESLTGAVENATIAQEITSFLQK